MPGFYHQFTRTLPPADEGALLTALRGLDATSGIDVTRDGATVRVKKATAFTPGQITATQNAIDTAPAATPQTAAQTIIDNMPIFEKAIILALIDQLNVIRSKLSPPLGNITAQAAIQAVRDKAGTL